MQLLQSIEDICYLFYLWDLLLLFLSNQENLYMIYLDSDLFYEICNTITENKDKLKIFY